MKVILPKTKEDFEKYYDLRWRILRKPWGQPRGSEKDELDNTSYHVMVAEKEHNPIGVARLQFNNDNEAQIRYMAVDERHQRRGVGSLILQTLEKFAREKHTSYIILHAREPAVPFYQKHGYHIAGKSYLLFDSIQHFLMKKIL